MEPASAILAKLEITRRELLDLTARNRLINTPRTSQRSGRLEIIHERADEVFRILVREGQSMSFRGRELAEADKAAVDRERAEDLVAPWPEELAEDRARDIDPSHSDQVLDTNLRPDQLQQKLLKLFYDARTFEEEQGVNILYLAVGYLKWFEVEHSDKERFAPLLLIPVELSRNSASAQFKVKYTGAEITTNLSLQEKLRSDFGLNLPDITEPDQLSPSDYFDQVRQVIQSQARWSVLDNDMVLWFFSFAKFLMYRDLQPENWSDEQPLHAHPLLSSLLQDGFGSDCPPLDDLLSGEQEPIDRILQPLDTIHVMDADSSQAIAIEEVRRGRNLVIQGPPGTGKSQTITNLIATAVKEGKTVLFVAEKMAALEVVKRRLDTIGLGAMCLELHSHKAKKRDVLEDLERTCALRSTETLDIARQAEELQACREQLNQHVEVLHRHIEPAHVTPYQAIGEMIRLRANGARSLDIMLPDALGWTPAELQQRKLALNDLASHACEVVDPQLHPWRGVRLTTVIPTVVERISALLPGLITKLGQLSSATKSLAQLLDYAGAVDTFFDCSIVGQFAKFICDAPAMDRKAVANRVWDEQRITIDSLLAAGQTLAAARAELQDIVTDEGWSTDVSLVRRHLLAHGRSWSRFLSRDYRRAQATLRGILTSAPPKPLSARLKILDQLTAGHKAIALLNQPHHQQIGAAAFGSYWRGVDSDWAALQRIVAWETKFREAKLPGDYRTIAAGIQDPDSLREGVSEIASRLKPVMNDLENLCRELDLDVPLAFATKSLRTASLQHIETRLKAWQQDPESIYNWIAYWGSWRKLGALGLDDLARKLDSGDLKAGELVASFEQAYFESLIRWVFEQHDELATFKGSSHERLRRRFCELDKQRVEYARWQVAQAHLQRLPQPTGESKEEIILRREFRKKRNHLPLRQLLQQAGSVIQNVKPVFMMSPISIAQYFEPNSISFDLLIFDEASQVLPVDALGAISRARQLVVVGDDRQLPPTRFFNRLVDDEVELSDEVDFQARDMESILGLCQAQNMPARMLQWHYRSRHHSLIAVSNREFYDNRLFIVPNPSELDEDVGLKFRHIAEGVFDRGGARTNPQEAKAIADAVMEHARRSPNKTLGVGAFSVTQRDAILNELELRRRGAPELESFFAASTAEPFFVKNLENIQGDERDVILISVGYGKDGSGYMAMNFGPLNYDGGERRLNVLITRARERCEIFSSITAEDIDLNRTTAHGVRSLRNLLTYAQTGQLDVGEITNREYGSEFERQVGQALIAEGFRVDSQIGVAGFFIDLAIRDPEHPGRFMLGIECDGATYHSSRSARDRDRLRQQVLEDRGWSIHRIWSTDWFRRPGEELRKVKAAVERLRR